MKRALLLTLTLAAAACSAGADPGDDAAQGESNLGTDPSIPRLPAPGGTGDLTPWGGNDASKWRPEAILANAASQALNAAWSRPDVRDVVVAAPTKLWSSGFFEFGDGQANARPDFVWWQGQSRPPLVATLIQFKNAPTKVVFRFDRALPYAGTAFELQYGSNLVPLTAQRDAQGDAVIEWTLPQDVSWNDHLSAQAGLIRPTGWADWFPLQFKMPVKPISQLRVSQNRFSDGRNIVDRERATSNGARDGLSVLQRLQGHSFSTGYNGTGGGFVAPFSPASIHATYLFYGQKITTGVGRGWTWVANERPAGLKVMYTCFERRRLDLEQSAPSGGVASGGGWHQINDSAETILNDVETQPLFAGAGQGNVWLESQLPSGHFAYGLTDITTYRWLRPGEAFITVKGQWVNDGSGRWYDQSNYHWYAFQQTRDVCTEEIVNPPGQVPVNYDL